MLVPLIPNVFLRNMFIPQMLSQDIGHVQLTTPTFYLIEFTSVAGICFRHFPRNQKSLVSVKIR